MFFILSKTITMLLMPASLIMLCLLAAWLFKKKGWKKFFFFTGLLLFFLFSNSFLINEIMLHWEVPPTLFKEVASDYDVGIILTGVTDSQKMPRDRVYFQKGADRVMHAVKLYKLGKIKNILVSGGSGSLIQTEYKEAEAIKEVLLLSGIPENRVFLEDESRNTRENAVNSTEMLNEIFPGKNYLLITSAFHMRRARACFEKAGVKVDTFSADFYTHERKFTPDVLLVPSEGAMAKWAIMIKEWLGMAAYKVAGYI